ncbi:MAG: phosphoribosylglycinamide formyltransferase [Alphaproteobacteria bacterium]|nr:phosphoribosylglycinamide formyltransferase [Alphaproteobacteria bacterium]
MLRLAVLISSRGSNMQALIEYTLQADVPAEIIGVIADNPAKGLSHAAAAGIHTLAINKSEYENRAAFEDVLAQHIDQLDVDIICLAGFMSVLSGDFCQRYYGKIINIHPSLLPAYKGLDTHQRAISDEAKWHGCSVHIVTPKIDDGPLLAQKAVAVDANDTATTLAAKVLSEEHIIYPMIIGALATGLLRFDLSGAQITPINISGVLPGVINGDDQMRWPIADITSES